MGVWLCVVEYVVDVVEEEKTKQQQRPERIRRLEQEGEKRCSGLRYCARPGRDVPSVTGKEIFRFYLQKQAEQIVCS